MYRKGVSPLIAAVLLIAFTLAIGGFLSGWLQQITRDQTEATKKYADSGCIYATFNTEEATFNATGDSKLVFDIISTGTRDININQITVTSTNMSQRLLFTSPQNFSGTVNTGDKVSMSLNIDSSVVSAISRVRIIPGDCPQNANEIKGSEITNYP